MPLSQIGSFSHTFIGVTYRCHCPRQGLTRTHISESHIEAMVSLAHIYQNPMS
ncbi:hypothetical protein F383_33787 [Gossypium arboreum]|uniref:Uncharacterized protein n=1 Tax=Gossypium arboreum TaxID=29729 RepID=A0A0B0N298_GOSAR|nr:hypothetical protein F383_33787 [Gossypium arboreum]